MTTWNAKPEEVEQKWYVVDVANKRLGRVATHIANVLRGKHKPTFTPNVDTGDFIVIINADKIELTGNKWDVKKYYRHSRFFGSLKEKTATQMKVHDPAFMIEDAVMGMLPNNRLSKQIIKKLKVYPGTEHPHAAQKPEALSFN